MGGPSQEGYTNAGSKCRRMACFSDRLEEVTRSMFDCIILMVDYKFVKKKKKNVYPRV
jgi:hypothetical protein